MIRYNKPPKSSWPELTHRPLITQVDLAGQVNAILDNVRHKGDKALIDYALRFDNVKLDSLSVHKSEINDAVDLISDELKDAIQIAYNSIYKFHKSQERKENIVDTNVGIKCWQKSVAIEKVGLYIPGGTAPLFSTVLMLGIPAQIAGCNELVLCTPPNTEGLISPEILYVAQLIGIDKIYKVGGAQAIAAMSFGTETVPQVYKIFGPGNQYVTKAKEIVTHYGVAIDMPAGPSELLVIADRTGIPEYIAADLLSQAEHGTDSQVVLLSNDASIIEATMSELDKQKDQLPRKEIINKSIEKSMCILLESIEECITFSNIYAPEHLIIASENAEAHTYNIINAGSVFLGNYSCESAGDYASGTNHTLPTNGYAKQYSGVSLDSFIKKITFQKLSRKGIETIGPAVEVMAEAEGLMAHKNAITVRLKS